MTSSDDVPILDVAYLARQTCADRALQRELLTLFDGQCRRLGPEIVRSADPASRSEAAHALLGAARAVGALRVAAIAADIEALGAKASPRADLTRQLERALGEVREAIAAELQMTMIARQPLPGRSETWCQPPLAKARRLA